jgi:hypothetical protein
VTEVARVAREIQGAAEAWPGWGSTGSECLSRGTADHGGGRASPPPLARGRTGAPARRRFASPYRPARGTRRYEPRELADA